MHHHNYGPPGAPSFPHQQATFPPGQATFQQGQHQGGGFHQPGAGGFHQGGNAAAPPFVTHQANNGNPYLLTGNTAVTANTGGLGGGNAGGQKLTKMFPTLSMGEILEAFKKNNYDLQKTISYLLDKMIESSAMTEHSQMAKFQSSQVPPSPEHSYLAHNDFAAPQWHPGLKPAQQIGEDTRRASGRKRALIIGINYEGSQYQLGGCRADATKIKDLLVQVYGFPEDPSSLIFMTDKKGTDSRLIPTKRNMIKGFRWLVNDVQEGDTLFLHYSGHGSQQADLSMTESDGLDETILPMDWETAGMITDDDLAENLIQPLKSGVKMVVVLDCCHSGSGMDLPYVLNSRSGQWDTQSSKSFAAADVVLISGCQDSETAADVNLSSFGAGGALTISLVATLAANPFNTTFLDLLRQMGVFLKTQGLPQNPNISSSQRFAAGSSMFNFEDIHENRNQMVGHVPSQRPPRPGNNGDLVALLANKAKQFLAAQFAP